MSKLWDSPWFYRVLALVLAVCIFAYVNAENLTNTVRQTSSTDTSILANKKTTVTVPLQVNADTEKYFITGYPTKVKVTVEGPSALVTAVSNTQNFRVVADLRKLTVGTHTVALRAEGLNKGLTSTIKPAHISVHIRNRINKTMAVQVHYNQKAIASGYEAGTPVLSTQTVEVSGARAELASISQISANVNLQNKAKSDVDQSVVLQALDDQGQTVNVVLTPETVQVKLPINLPSKKVDVEATQTGKVVSGLNYDVKTNVAKVTLYGAKAVLNSIDKISIPVDISKVTDSKTETVNLTKYAKGLNKISPASVKVNIKVTADKESSSNSSSDSAN